MIRKEKKRSDAFGRSFCSRNKTTPIAHTATVVLPTTSHHDVANEESLLDSLEGAPPVSKRRVKDTLSIIAGGDHAV